MSSDEGNECQMKVELEMNAVAMKMDEA